MAATDTKPAPAEVAEAVKWARDLADSYEARADKMQDQSGWMAFAVTAHRIFVSRLRTLADAAERAPTEAHVDDAYRRGAEAMREAAKRAVREIGHAQSVNNVAAVTVEALASIILPELEPKP